MYCFPMLGEREKLLPETPLICKDYKDSDIDINAYSEQWFHIF